MAKKKSTPRKNKKKVIEKSYAFGGDMFGDQNTMGMLNAAGTGMSAMTQPQTQDEVAGEGVFNAAREGVAGMNPIIGAFHKLGKAGETMGSKIDTSDPERGNAMSKSFFNPFGSGLELAQNDNATDLEKVGGVMLSTMGLHGVTGQLNNKANKRGASNEAMKQYKANPMEGSFAFGGPMKYQSGGSLPNYVDVGPDITPGSTQHRDMMKLQQDKQFYDQQQQFFTNNNVSPVELSKSEFEKKYNRLETDRVPEGNSVYNFGKNLPPEGGPGLVPFTYGPTGEQFLTGMSNPGEVPDYNLFQNEVDMSIEPETLYENPPEQLKNSNQFIKQNRNAYYTDPSGNKVQMDPNSRYDKNTGYYQAPNGTLYKPDGTMDVSNVKPAISFAMGGKVDNMGDGGKFVEYEGPTHGEGGINIDANGMPTNNQQATAEVEGNETMHDNGVDKYMFSARLVPQSELDKKNKSKKYSVKTYADLSKSINNKYKDADTDPVQKESRDMELERLKADQEAARQELGQIEQSNGQNNVDITGGQQQIPQQAYGGGLPKYGDGGGLDYMTPKAEDPFILEGGPYAPINTQGQTGFGIVDDYNNMFPPNQAVGPITENGNAPVLPNEVSLNNTKDNSTNGLPQDKINPLGYAASNIGNIYDLAQAAKKSDPNDFGRMNPNLVNLEAQREEARRQAGVSQAIARENSRNSSSAGGAMTNQVISNALINSGLGSQLGQSYMTEANTNAQIKNQAEQVNTQMEMQEGIADQQDKAARRSMGSQALHGIGANTQGYIKDIKAADVGNMNNKMWFDLVKEGKYVDYDYSDGKLIMTTKDGRKIEMKKKADGSFVEANK